MILYHGTNSDFEKIDIAKTQLHKDFGQGFYLTDIRQQAERMAMRKTRMLGGKPVVQEYELDETKLSELTKQLEYKQLNKQYYFGSERATSLLKRIK